MNVYVQMIEGRSKTPKYKSVHAYCTFFKQKLLSGESLENVVGKVSISFLFLLI